jgi:molecular chaperone GrpE
MSLKSKILKKIKSMSTNNEEALKDEQTINQGTTAENTEATTENSTSESNDSGKNDTETSSNEQQIIELEKKIAEEKDKYLRLYSEFDNYRKRSVREKGELIKTAGEDFFKAILPVIDDFERALKAADKTGDINTIAEGVQLIYSKLKSTLKQKGLEEMEASGKTFDADVMEAITSIPAPNDDLKGKVVDEIEKGYSLNGKVIRYAKVVIGN